jgi:hypothetical protein
MSGHEAHFSELRPAGDIDGGPNGGNAMKALHVATGVLALGLAACGYGNKNYNNEAAYNEGATYNESAENYSAGNYTANATGMNEINNTATNY